MAGIKHGHECGVDIMNRKALSPVISTLILASAVIVIGGSIWSYSISASTMIAENYVNDTMELVNEVTERFVVEHVGFDSTTNQTSIWVYNYGEQTITVDAYINVTTSSSSFMDSYSGTEIQKGESVKITVDMSETITTGDRAAIKIMSKRSNIAYKTYYFP